jgi:hypothetical protein
MNPDRATAKQKCEKFWTLPLILAVQGKALRGMYSKNSVITLNGVWMFALPDNAKPNPSPEYRIIIKPGWVNQVVRGPNSSI